MSLVGVYKNATLNASLEITEANVSNGQGKGSFSMGGQTYEVAIHFHFENNTGQATVLQVWASNLYGWNYMGGAGSTDSQSGANGISLAGGVSDVNNAHSFSGLFAKS